MKNTTTQWLKNVWYKGFLSLSPGLYVQGVANVQKISMQQTRHLQKVCAILHNLDEKNMTENYRNAEDVLYMSPKCQLPSLQGNARRKTIQLVRFQVGEHAFAFLFSIWELLDGFVVFKKFIASNLALLNKDWELRDIFHQLNKFLS